MYTLKVVLTDGSEFLFEPNAWTSAKVEDGVLIVVENGGDAHRFPLTSVLYWRTYL